MLRRDDTFLIWIASVIAGGGFILGVALQGLLNKFFPGFVDSIYMVIIYLLLIVGWIALFVFPLWRDGKVRKYLK